MLFRHFISMQSYILHIGVVPERKCILMRSAYKDAGYTYTINRLQETAKTFRNLGDAYGQTSKKESGWGRQLILVADILEECVSMNLNAKIPDRQLYKQLEKKSIAMGIMVKDIRLLDGKRREILVTAKTFMRGCVSERVLRGIVSDVFGVKFFSNQDNRVIINEEPNQYVFYQEDRFRILTGMARKCKESESTSGDNFLMKRLGCGKMVAAIADGCGSGKRAFAESRMVIELMENCIEAGFEEKTAIDLINSAYIAGTSLSNPVTMDMSVIDCQAGVINCIKLGAVSTFIKRDNWVEIIKSTTLPMGVLDQVDYDCTTKKLYDGDYIIMISDGVLDNLSGVNKEEQLVEIINNINDRKPATIAKRILEASLKSHNMEAFDDCTVMVLGVFDTYVNL